MASAISCNLTAGTGVMTLLLGGCSSYVKRTGFAGAVAQLRAAGQRPQDQVDSLSQKRQPLVTRLAGRTRSGPAHFEAGDATLSEQDKALLDDFSKVIRDNRRVAFVIDYAGSGASA